MKLIIKGKNKVKEYQIKKLENGLGKKQEREFERNFFFFCKILIYPQLFFFAKI